MGCEYAHGEYACQAYAHAPLLTMLNEHETAGMNMQAALGRAIAQLRIKAGHTQEQVAEYAGLGQSAISRVEKGTQGLSTESITAIGKGLGVPVSTIWATAESLLGGAAPTAYVHETRPRRQSPAANAAQDIDVLRYAVSVLFSATAAFRPEAAKKMAATIRAEKRPEFAHLVEDRFVRELLDALEADVRKTKTRRSSR